MKKLTAVVLCAILALAAFACTPNQLEQLLESGAEKLEQKIEDNADKIEQIGENLGDIGEQIGENLGDIGEQIGEGLGGMQIPNPFVDFASLDEAEKAAGFALKIPATPDNLKPIVQVMDGKMIQVIFSDENGDPQVYLRKQAGDEDISGDYNEYAEITTETVGDHTVTLKGNDGKVSTAIWTANGYSYAVMFETPVEKDQILSLIGEIA